MKKRTKIILGIVGIIFVLIILAGIFGEDDVGPALNDTIIDENRISDLPADADILFVSNRDTGSRRAEIYSMNADGSNQQRLTYTNEHHFLMGIDNSRRYIVTSRMERDTNKPKGLGDEDRRSLWIIDLQTKQETRLTNIEDTAEGRTFSPNGEWIVFMMTVQGEEQADIYKIKKDGTSLTKLTDIKTSIEGDPAWSNNGDKIAFSYLDGLDENLRFITKKMDINGENIETVYDVGEGGVETTGAWLPGSYDSAWSPNDEWIVFEMAVENTGGNAGSGNWHIFKIKSDGTELTDLSELGGHIDRAEYLPSFSNNGSEIVYGSIYLSGSESHNDIFKMDADTGIATRLTNDASSNMYPVWI